MKFTSGTSNISYIKAGDANNTGSATVTERTIFLYERKDGTFSRYVGRTAPGIVNNAGNAYPLDESGDPTGAETFSIRVSKSGEALVVFMGNVDPVSEWKDNWAYVYNTKVAQNGDAYLVQAIIDGKPEEYLVEQAYGQASDGDWDKELIQPDVDASGIYQHVMPVGLYNFTVDGNIYTLTREHLNDVPSYNVQSVIVDAFRSSYIRAGNSSYTITDETQMFEARKNKTAQTISSVNQGDEVTIVYNDDNEAVYIFLTEFSYNIMDTNYQPSINDGTSDTSNKTLDTDGGLVGNIALNSFTQNNLKYQWYKSTDNSNTTTGDDVALADNMGYTGSTTAALSINKGTLTAGDYYFYCVVSNTDKNGITDTDTSNVVRVTVTTAPVAGSLRVVAGTGVTATAVVVNNTPVTLTTVGSDKWATGISKGDVVEIIATEFNAGDKWTVTGVGDVEVVTEDVLKFTMPNESVTLTSASQVVTVSYEVATGSGTFEDVSSHVGSTITLADAATPAEGYQFIGWTDGANLYAAGDTSVALTDDTQMTAVYLSNTVEATDDASSSGLGSSGAGFKFTTTVDVNTAVTAVSATGTGTVCSAINATGTVSGDTTLTADITTGTGHNTDLSTAAVANNDAITFTLTVTYKDMDTATFEVTYTYAD